MMHTIDPIRVAAFMRLLAQPDPSDLPRRGHVYRCQGDPNRRATRLPGILLAWLQRRILENDGEVADVNHGSVYSPLARQRPRAHERSRANRLLASESVIALRSAPRSSALAKP
jgi:hypothetical protein